MRLDLCDLRENLDRILESPHEARLIVANARKLALEVMTLDHLGFRYGEPNVIDVTPVAERFKAFLSAALDLEIATTADPAAPSAPS